MWLRDLREISCSLRLGRRPLPRRFLVVLVLSAQLQRVVDLDLVFLPFDFLPLLFTRISDVELELELLELLELDPEVPLEDLLLFFVVVSSSQTQSVMGSATVHSHSHSSSSKT